MPVYDRRCLACAWTTDFALEPVQFASPVCPECGGQTERYWTTSPTVVPDTFHEPVVDDMMAKQTQTFYSRSERKAAMRLHGKQEMIRHTHGPESDKSRHTTSWLSGPPPGCASRCISSAFCPPPRTCREGGRSNPGTS